MDNGKKYLTMFSDGRGAYHRRPPLSVPLDASKRYILDINRKLWEENPHTGCGEVQLYEADTKGRGKANRRTVKKELRKILIISHAIHRELDCCICYT